MHACARHASVLEVLLLAPSTRPRALTALPSIIKCTAINNRTAPLFARPEFVDIVSVLCSMLRQLQQPPEPLPQLPPAVTASPFVGGPVGGGSGGTTYYDSGAGWGGGRGCGGAAGMGGGGLAPTPEGTSTVCRLVGEVMEEIRLEEGGEGSVVGEGSAAARQVPADAPGYEVW